MARGKRQQALMERRQGSALDGVLHAPRGSVQPRRVLSDDERTRARVGHWRSVLRAHIERDEKPLLWIVCDLGGGHTTNRLGRVASRRDEQVALTTRMHARSSTWT
jgi:hypothetical protein